ncbi:hypothetical protein FOMG_17980 [Fusarium oxysporum f. sp. melonis 26406]|uniref:Uncharacterized protein n=1 Tax=Fusarium oxysporum f. sp. melonis 26406 TaxID=1089452 RepID=W9Z9P4_FUSOX|nr:hypothetical protein FOMG_17980 [Fusarium oxysporum f. sp. melonis 26406]
MDPASLLVLVGPLIGVLSTINATLKEHLDRLDKERQALPVLKALKVECDVTERDVVVIRNVISSNSSQRSGQRDELVGILRSDLQGLDQLVKALSKHVAGIFKDNKSPRDLRKAVVNRKEALRRKINNIRRKRQGVQFITHALQMNDNLHMQKTLDSMISRLGNGEEKSRELMKETAGENRPDVIERLLDEGADPNFLAIDFGSPDDPKVVAPLLNAIRGAQHSYEAVDVLLTKGALPNLVVGDQPPLWLAFQCGNVDVATLLLDFGADVECPCVKGAGRRLLGTTIASKDFAHQRAELIQLALEYEANTEVRAPDGNRPLHDAVQMRRGKGVVNMLLTKNADVSSRARENLTPLMMAAQIGDLEVVSLLATFSVETKQTSRDGLTASDMARRGGYPDIEEVLNTYDA